MTDLDLDVAVEVESRRQERLAEPYSEWYGRTVPKHWAGGSEGPPVPRHIAYILDLVDRVVRGEILRLAVSLPPGHGKSATITRRLPVYWGERHPEDAVVVTGYSQRFADKHLSYPARETARELGVLSPDASALDEWELSNGARIVSRGVGSAPTGINPISLLCGDDPLKDRAQAESETERENQWQWWTGSIVQRFFPRTRAVLIATRWHEEDLIGRLMAEEADLAPEDRTWTFVNLPALSMGADVDPLGREEGEALWPEVKPAPFLLQLRREMGEREFEALFQGNPTPREGTLFKPDKLRFVRRTPDWLPACRGWDLAATEDAGDYTAGIKMSGPDEEGTFYVDPLRFRHEPAKRNRLIRQTAELDGPEVRVRVPQDPGAAGKESAQSLIRLLAGYPVKAEPVSGKKELRAEPFADQVNAGNVAVVTHGTPQGKEAAEAFKEELRTFPNGSNDDQVDGASDALAELTRPSDSRPVVAALADEVDAPPRYKAGGSAYEDIREPVGRRWQAGR